MRLCRAVPERAAVALMLVLAACSGGSPTAPGIGLPLAAQPQLASSGKIKHVVIVVQENRSLNNLFMGFPGARTVNYGYDSYGHRIKLKPVSLATKWDIDHSANTMFEACDGTGSIPGTDCKMDGFNLEVAACGTSPRCPIKHPQYAYAPYSETKPYFDIAKQYVLADEMYASDFDASSFVSHQYIISGQALSSVDYPIGPWGCSGGSHNRIIEVGPQRQLPYGQEVPCWDPTTLGDELDSAGVSWAYYAVSHSGFPGLWSAYQAINHVFNGPDWSKDVISPPSQFLRDVKNGRLRSVSWVTPTCRDSDHAGCNSVNGPSWVSSLVNAVGGSKYWDSTAMFIFWDDYGGWYDPAPPAYVDYDGVGFRLPMLVVSPYAKQGYVSHVHYEHGSMLKFVEDLFGLPRLAASDTRAKSPAKDCFDFNQAPRKFKKIPSPLGIDYFLHEAPDRRPPDTQ
jgi:phospholipase C